MKRQMSWALLAGGIALAAATATAAPAAAATTGSQTFKGTIVTSGVSGARTVITSVIIAKGAFSGVGRIVEVENLPGDEDNVSPGRPRLRQRQHAPRQHEPGLPATLRQSTQLRGHYHDPPDRGNRRRHRAVRNATGSFDGTVTGRLVLARNPDGSCSFEHVPLHQVDMTTATGTLTHFEPARRGARHPAATGSCPW